MNTPTVPTLVLPFLVIGGLLVGTVQPSTAAEPLVGGYSDVPTTNAQVIAAARFAVSTQAVSKWPLIGLVEIMEAEQQVAAGMNYRLQLKVKVKRREAEAVVWRKLSGEHELTSWTWK